MRREVISLDSPAPSLGAEIGLSSSSLQVRFKCGFVLDQLTCPHSISKRIYTACCLCIYYRKGLLWHLPEDITPAPPPHLTFQRQTSWERSSESVGAAVWVAVLYWGLFPQDASLVAQLVKNPPEIRETWVWSLGWEDPLKKGKATHSSIWPGKFHRLYGPWGHKEWLRDFHFSLPPQDRTDLSDQISRSVVSDTLRPHESQHARPPCPSPTPGVHSDSCPLSHFFFPWC